MKTADLFLLLFFFPFYFSPNLIQDFNKRGFMYGELNIYGNNKSCLTCDYPIPEGIRNIKDEQAIFYWHENEDAVKYEYELGLPGFLPGSGSELKKGTTSGVERLITGLSVNTNYEFVIRSICENNDTSAFSPPVHFRTNPGCGGALFDTGGPALNYSTNLETSQLICPDDPDHFARLDFSEFDLTDDGSYVRIHSGTSISFSVIGTWFNNENPGTVEARYIGGCLLVVTSSGAEASTGWEADYSCVTCIEPYNIKIEYRDFFTTIEWDGGQNVLHYNIEFGFPGFIPGTGNDVENLNIGTSEINTVLPLIDQNEAYHFYVRALCENGDTSAFVGPYYFKNNIECGDDFYDPGGPFHSYLPGEYRYELCPDEEGRTLQLEFEEISFDHCCAALWVSPNGFQEITIFSNDTLPEPFTSINYDGCLDVRFLVEKNGGTGDGWAAKINCLCPDLKSLRVAGMDDHRATISWTAISTSINKIEWNIMSRGVSPNNGAPVLNGLASASIYYVTVSNLEPNTDYDLYARVICPLDTGNYSGVVPFRTAPACGDYFYDMGGPDEDYIIVDGQYATIFCPEEDWQVAELVFEEFDVGPASSFKVYEGSTVGNPILIDEFFGDSITPSFVSTVDDKCLTVGFTNFNGIPAPGWKAKFNCLDCPPVFNLVGIYGGGVDTTVIKWNATEKAVNYHWEIGQPGFAPNSNEYLFKGTTEDNSNELKIGGLEKNTFYEIYFTVNCGAFGESYLSKPFKFMTMPSCGDLIFDPGGPNAAYANNENAVFSVCPEIVNGEVSVEFNFFNTEFGSDFLSVYNHEIEDGNAITFLSGPVVPAPLPSLLPGRCLQFKFTSDESNVGLGWEAKVICDPSVSTVENEPDYQVQIFPNPFNDVFSISINSIKNEEVAIEVLNLNGEKIIQHPALLQTGNNKIDIYLDGLASGIYIVKLFGEYGQAVRRILKR